MATRAKRLMIDELGKIKRRMNPSRLSEKDTRVMIQCPFHDDGTPSGGINLDETITVPLGWFSCFGCKKSVPWNELAAKLGMREISGAIARKTNANDYNSPSDFKEELLDDDEAPDSRFQEQMKEFHFFDFKEPMWRGFPTTLLESLGARLMYWDYSEDFYVWFPVMILGKLRGYVRSTMKKSKPSSHYNAPGKWSRTHGLLFFDQSVALMKKLNKSTVVLCEGPRDALRLLMEEIPAICVLGAGNWNDEKRFVLEQTGAENLILMMDGDLTDKHGKNPGKDATTLIYNSVKTHFNTKYVSLWKHAEKLGKKMDPCTCDHKFIDQVRKALK